MRGNNKNHQYNSFSCSHKSFYEHCILFISSFSLKNSATIINNKLIMLLT